MADKYLLENGTDRFLLEDGTSLLLKDFLDVSYSRAATNVAFTVNTITCNTRTPAPDKLQIAVVYFDNRTTGDITSPTIAGYGLNWNLSANIIVGTNDASYKNRMLLYWAYGSAPSNGNLVVTTGGVTIDAILVDQYELTTINGQAKVVQVATANGGSLIELSPALSAFGTKGETFAVFGSAFDSGVKFFYEDGLYEIAINDPGSSPHFYVTFSQNAITTPTAICSDTVRWWGGAIALEITYGIFGTVGADQGSQTVSVTGNVSAPSANVTGTANISQAQTSNGIGALAFTTTATSGQGSQTVNISGLEVFAGSETSGQAGQTANGVAVQQFVATANSGQGSQTANGAAVLRFTGTETSSQAQTANGSGLLKFIASETSGQGNQTVDAAGTTAASGISGTATSGQGSQTVNTSAAQVFLGSGNSSQAQTANASASLSFTQNKIPLAVRSSSSSAANSGVGIEPAGAIQGDLLVAYVTSYTAGANPTPPAGWTLDNATSFNGAVRISTWRTIRGANAPALTWTDGGGMFGVTMFCISGFDPNTPMDAVSTFTVDTTGTVSTPIAPSITTATDTSMLLFGLMLWNAQSITSVPAGTTQDFISAALSQGGAHKQTFQAGATPTYLWTLPAGNLYVAVTTAIRPTQNVTSATADQASQTTNVVGTIGGASGAESSGQGSQTVDVSGKLIFTGSETSSQAQTANASGLLGFVGTETSSQAQTANGVGTVGALAFTGTATTGQAQTVDANALLRFIASETSSQAQTADATGFTATNVTGTTTTGQGSQTVNANALLAFIGADASGQANQTVSATGLLAFIASETSSQGQTVDANALLRFVASETSGQGNQTVDGLGVQGNGIIGTGVSGQGGQTVDAAGNAESVVQALDGAGWGKELVFDHRIRHKGEARTTQTQSTAAMGFVTPPVVVPLAPPVAPPKPAVLRLVSSQPAQSVQAVGFVSDPELEMFMAMVMAMESEEAA